MTSTRDFRIAEVSKVKAGSTVLQHGLHEFWNFVPPPDFSRGWFWHDFMHRGFSEIFEYGKLLAGVLISRWCRGRLGSRPDRCRNILKRKKWPKPSFLSLISVSVFGGSSLINRYCWSRAAGPRQKQESRELRAAFGRSPLTTLLFLSRACGPRPTVSIYQRRPPKKGNANQAMLLKQCCSLPRQLAGRPVAGRRPNSNRK